MKSLFVFSACVAITGAAIAAGVPGNNTAVIIRKAPVESDTGYQFLCLPVRGFDITGQGQTKGVPLNDVLPPTTEGFSESTTLTIQGNSEEEGYAANTSWRLTKGSDGALAWTPNDGDSTGEDLVQNKAYLWLNAKGVTFTIPGIAVATETSERPAETIFCGEQHTQTEKIVAYSGDMNGMLMFGNNTSEPVDIYDVADLQNGDQLLRVQAGSSSYLTYIYYNDGQGIDKWEVYRENGHAVIPRDKTTDGTSVTDEERTIAPGEAFYYYRAASAQ